MNLAKYLKNEINDFCYLEKIIFSSIILLTIAISIYMNDSKIALISAICGMSYTILAGKGKVSCYFIGMIGTVCYCYLSYKNGFWGNLLLYALYYFPMEIIGIFKWLKHLKKDKQEIIKTKLSKKEKIIYLTLAIIFSIIVSFILKYTGGKTPIIDSITTVFSIIGQLLMVKRCIEQWYVWFIVNLLSLIMWIIAYMNGSNCLATVIMWGVYWILTFYFYYTWTKELKENP